jgi:hypothetical protein
MVVSLLLLLFFVIWLFNSMAFDRLIEYQYQNYHEEWLSDGKPRGMFYKPKGSSVLTFWLKSFTLHKKTPYWASDDDNAIALHNRLVFWQKVVKWYFIGFIPALILLKMI